MLTGAAWMVRVVPRTPTVTVAFGDVVGARPTSPPNRHWYVVVAVGDLVREADPVPSVVASPAGDQVTPASVDAHRVTVRPVTSAPSSVRVSRVDRVVDAPGAMLAGAASIVRALSLLVTVTVAFGEIAES
jgi:hypothetical protein